MEWITGMNVAINYIEEHILEEIDYGKPYSGNGCDKFEVVGVNIIIKL